MNAPRRALSVHPSPMVTWGNTWINNRPEHASLVMRVITTASHIELSAWRLFVVLLGAGNERVGYHLAVGVGERQPIEMCRKIIGSSAYPEFGATLSDGLEKIAGIFKIRNKFAHSLIGFSEDLPEMIVVCTQTETLRFDQDKELRNKLQSDRFHKIAASPDISAEDILDYMLEIPQISEKTEVYTIDDLKIISKKFYHASTAIVWMRNMLTSQAQNDEREVIRHILEIN